jgi:protein TonB
MKGGVIYGPLLLLLLLSATITLHAQTDTVHTEKRLIDELPTQPEFPGDIHEYLAKNIRYPHIAKENSVVGKVYVRFLIDENGNVTDAYLPYTRRLGAGLEDEALRVVKTMPAWQPATYNGKAVRVVYTLPVHFRLE